MWMKLYVAELKRKRSEEDESGENGNTRGIKPLVKKPRTESAEALKKVGWQRGKDGLLRRVQPEKPSGQRLEVVVPPLTEAKPPVVPPNVPNVPKAKKPPDLNPTVNKRDVAVTGSQGNVPRTHVIPVSRRELVNSKLVPRQQPIFAPRPTSQVETVVEERDRSPKLIKALAELYKDKTTKKFDIIRFLSTVSMADMSLLDVLWSSPALRREVIEGLRVEPKAARLNLLMQNPTLG